MGNRDVVRQGYDAWNRRDVPALRAVSHPKVVFQLTGIFLGLEREYRGHEGVSDFMAAINEPWEEFVIEVARLEELDDSRVLGLVTFRGRGRDGITVERDFGHIFTLRDGLVESLQAYLSWDEALAVANLAQES